MLKRSKGNPTTKLVLVLPSCPMHLPPLLQPLQTREPSIDCDKPNFVKLLDSKKLFLYAHTFSAILMAPLDSQAIHSCLSYESSVSCEISNLTQEQQALEMAFICCDNDKLNSDREIDQNTRARYSAGGKGLLEFAAKMRGCNNDTKELNRPHIHHKHQPYSPNVYMMMDRHEFWKTPRALTPDPVFFFTNQSMGVATEHYSTSVQRQLPPVPLMMGQSPVLMGSLSQESKSHSSSLKTTTPLIESWIASISDILSPPSVTVSSNKQRKIAVVNSMPPITKTPRMVNTCNPEIFRGVLPMDQWNDVRNDISAILSSPSFSDMVGEFGSARFGNSDYDDAMKSTVWV